MYKLAGSIGVDPGPFTMRQLFHMHLGVQEREWSQVSCILAMIHNSKCVKKKDLRTPAFFNPYATEKEKKLKRPGDVVVGVEIYKELLPYAKAVAKGDIAPPTVKGDEKEGENGQRR